MARYFQHLNPMDPDFQKVTTLEEIDNTDPNFVLYYFKDGSKCNKFYIGELNDTDAFGKKEFVEVSDKYNIWKFNVTEVKRENAKPRYTMNAQGERVEIPSLMDYTESKAQAGTKVNVVSKPEFVLPSEEADIAPEVTAPAISAPAQITPTPAVNTESAAKTVEQPIANKAGFDITPSVNLDNLDDSIKLEFTYNGQAVALTKSELIKKAMLKPEERIIEKVVEKEVIKPVSNDHIEIGLTDDQRKLVDNMIDMAQKEECDIDMEITLSLPPVTVYQLIKSVYPDGMAKGFVNIIADRMQIKELKAAVAAGLLAYYDEDADVEISTSTDNRSEVASDASTDVSTAEESAKKANDSTAKKASRAKKA